MDTKGVPILVLSQSLLFRESLLLDSRVLGSPLSENRNSFLRPLKNKGFKEESMTKVWLYAVDTSTTLECNKSPRWNWSWRVRYVRRPRWRSSAIA